MRMRSNAIIHMEIPGTPIAKPRMSQKDRWNPSPAVLRYYGWADLVKWHVASIIHTPFIGALTLSASFWLPVPKSVPKAERAERLRGPHVIKPDTKNLVAGLEDALNKVAWHDDALIVGYRSVMKAWTDAPQGYTTLSIAPHYHEPDVPGAVHRAQDALAGPQIRLPMGVRHG